MTPTERAAKKTQIRPEARGKHKQTDIVIGTRAKPLDDTIDLWLQQPRESSQAYEAFLTYRNLDRSERSLRAAAKILGKDESLTEKWSAEWSWMLRVRAFDMHIDQETIRAQVSEISKMRDRHANRAMYLQHVLTAPAVALSNELLANPDLFRIYLRDGEGKLLSGTVLLDRLHTLFNLAVAGARLYPEAVVSERLARGEPSDIHEFRGGVSPEQRAHVSDILEDDETRELALRLFERIHGGS